MDWYLKNNPIAKVNRDKRKNEQDKKNAFLGAGRFPKIYKGS